MPQDPIRVGILYSDVGPEAASVEVPIVQSIMLAIDEINKEGGLLERQLEYILVDPKVLKDGRYARWTELLLQDEGVEAVFGGRDSLQRKSIKFIMEKNNKLLFYPFPYEGLEWSDRVIYTGSIPNQYLFPCFYWAHRMYGKGRRYLMVYSDSLMGKALFALAQDVLKVYADTTLEGIQIPSENVDMKLFVKRLRAKQPDVIFESLDSINGRTSFYRELSASGWTPDHGAVFGMALSDKDYHSIGPEYLKGYYFSRTHFSSTTDPRLQAFVKSFQKTYGRNVHIGQTMESAYASVHLWANAVKKAGSLETEAVLQSLLQHAHESPVGRHFIHRGNHHAYSHYILGRFEEDGTYEVLLESEDPVIPENFPKFRTPDQWSQLVDTLIQAQEASKPSTPS